MTLQYADLKGMIPIQMLDGMLEQTKTTATIPALSSQEPMKFGDIASASFDDEALAEFVEESAPKSSQDIKPTVKVGTPHKAQVTYRTSNEFLWADEDYRLNILGRFMSKASLALGKALDLGVYFRLNPKTGTEITGWTDYINKTALRVEAGSGANPQLDLESAVKALTATGISPTGMAIAPLYSTTLATARYADGRKIYPDLGFGLGIQSVDGIKTASGTTVMGKARDKDATDNKVRAILGNFDSGIRWGIQKDLPFEVIPYGDPDNSGRDLKGHNEVALRAEVVFGWICYPEQFAVIEDKVA